MFKTDRIMAKALGRTMLMLFGVALVCRGQSVYAPSSSALVEGRVTCNDGNVSGRGASVQLIPLESLLPNNSSGSSASPNSPTTKSDFNGVYSFHSIDPGTYIVNATMDDYEDDLKLLRTTLNRYTRDQQKALLGVLPQIIVKVGGSVHQDLFLRRAGAISRRVRADVGGTISQSLVPATLLANAAASQRTVSQRHCPQPFITSFVLAVGYDR
jgi:hypothetical protein